MSDKPSSSSAPVDKTPSAASRTPATLDDGEIEKLLNREATAFQREIEVERILKAFKLKCVLSFSYFLSRALNISSVRTRS